MAATLTSPAAVRPTSWADRVFAPVGPVMRRLSLSAKFGVVATILLIPLCLLLGMNLLRINTELNYTRGEIVGARTVDELNQLITQVQQHRGFVNMQLAGNTSVRGQRETAKLNAIKVATEITTQLDKHGEFGLTKEWDTLNREAQRVLQSETNLQDAGKSFAEHSLLVQKLQDFTMLMAEKSGLLLDPEASTFLLMDLAVERVSRLSEAMAQVRGLGAGAMAKGEWTLEHTARFGAAKRAFEDASHSTELRLQALGRAGEPEPKGWREAYELSTAFITDVAGWAKVGALKGDSETVFRRGTVALDKLAEFTVGTVARLDTLLQARAERLARNRLLIGTMALAGIGLAMYLLFAVARSLRQAAALVIEAAQGLAHGNLSVSTALEGRDEFVQIARSMRQVQDTVNRLLHDANHMSAQHDAGDIDVLIPGAQFEGEYRRMAEAVNNMVLQHIAVKKMALGCVMAFGAGDLEAPMEKLPGKKAFINDGIEMMRKQLKEASAAAKENLRVRQALDGVSGSVMIADADSTVVYGNKAVMQMLATAQSDLRKDLPQFDVNRVINHSFDQFHKNPAHQRNMLSQLRETYRTQIKVGGRTFALIASPVFGSDGSRSGTVVEWADRTLEIGVENEIAAIVNGAVEGELGNRLALDG
ncbi:MAG: HAMP domain-containing protein, partial [Pseudomonadota bacterium]